MVVLSIETSGCQPQTIVIGRRGTYETTQIAFDLSYLVEAYGSGVAVLAVKRSQDESAYPAVVTQENNTLTWTVIETDTAYVGAGECQLMWYVEGGLAKTIIYPMVVMRDILQTAEEPPDGYENWVEHLTGLGAETQQNAQNASQSATEAKASEESAAESAQRAEDAAGMLVDVSATATTLEPGQPATAEYDEGVFKFGIPKGDKLTYADLTEADKEDLVQGPIKAAQNDAIEAVGTAKTNAVDAVNGAGTTQAQNVNSAGSTQVNTVNQAGTTQVGNVNQAGATQVQAIEDKGDEVIDSIPSDYSDLTAEVDNLTRQLSDLEGVVTDPTTGLDAKAPVILETASGAIASFSDGADSMPIKSLVAQIEPVQDLHGYDHPWPGGGGVNKFDQDTVFGNAGAQHESDGSWYFANVSVIQSGTPIWQNTSGYTGQITISFAYKTLNATGSQGARLKWKYSDDTEVIISLNNSTSFLSLTNTSTLGKTVSELLWDYGSAANSTWLKDVQVELNATATSYSTYSNICPISGRTEAEVTRTGKNLFDARIFAEYGGVLQTDGSYYFASPNHLYMQHLWDNVNRYDGQLALTWIKKDDTTATSVTAYPIVYYTDGTIENVPVSLSTQAFSTATLITSANRVVNYVTCSYGTNKPGWYKLQIELSSTATSFEEYKGATISVTFPETIYGGTDTLNPDGSADVVSAMGNIASYDGETLPGTWISSMDVYAEGATPTTGAQVVYELAEPDSYHFDDVGQFKTFFGTNNIWSSTGNAEVTYPADTKLYIDNAITQAIANALNS